MPLRDTEEDFRIKKDISWKRKCNIIRMSVLPQINFKLNLI